MSHEARPSVAFGPFRLDFAERRLLRDGRHVPLTPKNFHVLCVLVENSGRLVDKERLLKEVWPGTFVEEGALNRSVSTLRKALGENAEGPQYIETVPKCGYRFVASVTEASGDRGAVVPPASVEAGAAKRGTLAGALVVVVMLAAVLNLSGPSRTAPAAMSPAHRQVTFAGKEGTPALSPDGRRIAYVSLERENREVMVQELDGGHPVSIFSAPEVAHLRWSPDGSDLIVWARGAGMDGVYTVPQLGGTVRRIAPGRFIACWSPDGTTIAVASYLVGKLWFYDRQGSQQRVISLQGVPWSIWDLDWSAATGLLLLVSSDPKGHYTLWTIRPDGTHQQRIFEDTAEIPTARWAPDGRAIYYFRRLNQTDTLHKIVVDRSPPGDPGVRATLLSGLETDRSFALSADGRRLVYARAPYHSNIWTLERATGAGEWMDPKQLTAGTSLFERSQVSPDGHSIVVSIGREALANLYTLPISIDRPKPLTTFNAFSVSGAWSPDGRQIAFASTEGGKARVWIVGAGGDAARPVSSGELSESFDVTWSPGPRILYQQAGNRNYYELNPETREERLLVKDSSVGWIFSPVYSRDGRYVAVMWNRKPARGIWVIDTLTRRERLVYRTSALSARAIGWTPDDSRIYVVEAGKISYRGLMLPVGETTSDARIVTVPMNGGKAQTVAKLPFEIGTVSMSPDARTFVFSVYSSRSDVWIVDNFDTLPERH